VPAGANPEAADVQAPHGLIFDIVEQT